MLKRLAISELPKLQPLRHSAWYALAFALSFAVIAGFLGYRMVEAPHTWYMTTDALVAICAALVWAVLCAIWLSQLHLRSNIGNSLLIWTGVEEGLSLYTTTVDDPLTLLDIPLDQPILVVRLSGRKKVSGVIMRLPLPQTTETEAITPRARFFPMPISLITVRDTHTVLLRVADPDGTPIVLRAQNLYAYAMRFLFGEWTANEFLATRDAEQCKVAEKIADLESQLRHAREAMELSGRQNDYLRLIARVLLHGLQDQPTMFDREHIHKFRIEVATLLDRFLGEDDALHVELLQIAGTTGCRSQLDQLLASARNGGHPVDADLRPVLRVINATPAAS